MITIVLCILLAVIFNLPILIHARCRRRFAFAKLRLARSVTKMENMMLNAKIRGGDICHDQLYQDMLKSMYAHKYGVYWAFWKMRPQRTEAFRKKLRAEMEENSEIGGLISEYVRAEFSAFLYNRPFVARIFIVWVALFAGMIMTVFTAFVTVTKVRAALDKFKQTVAEYYAAPNVRKLA